MVSSALAFVETAGAVAEIDKLNEQSVWKGTIESAAFRLEGGHKKARRKICNTLGATDGT